MTLNDGIKGFQRSIDSLVMKINDPILCEKLRKFAEADEETKDVVRSEAVVDDIDLIVAILRSELFSPELTPEQIGKVFNAYVAWNNAVENVSICTMFSTEEIMLIMIGRRGNETGSSAIRLPEAAA